jgi:diguanylate cyclase (GGDEF)-like protein
MSAPSEALDRPLSDPSEASALRRRVALVRHWLPQGQMLPEHIWRRRHATIVWLVWLHAGGLFAFGLAQGRPLGQMVADISPILVAAYLAGSETLSMKLRSGAASFGLVTCSAVLVHLWDGVIEAHFHFFVVIGILTLYQDWVPFLIAITYVVVHHGLMGVIAPSTVYNHPDAIAHPWKWAIIHGGFVLAASAAHIVAWRTNETQLLRDPLTGLPSRLLFLNRLNLALDRLARRPGRQVAVLFLDLDRFKVINDSLGHPAGDKLILAVAERLRHSLRRHETIARFGGDEFAILCEDIADEQDAVAVAERVLKLFGTPFQLADGDTTTGASIGIALSASPDQIGEDLVRDADAAMYRAKGSGGGRFLLFDELTRQRAVARLETEKELRRAIEREELRVFFQPEVSIATGALVGVEALVRWQHPERGLLGPGEFISLAEETGLIVPLGTWVLRESCQVAQAWHDEGLVSEDFSMRVNVSARQLASDRLPGTVAAILAQTGLHPAGLCLEVTETLLIEDPTTSVATLTALKELGVEIAVDDFGTGYSSLQHLRNFPIDCVKIDRSFVRGLPDSTEDGAIVGAVIKLGHALNLSVTAEGVETSAQLENLQASGCDTAQGFLFSRPEPVATIEAQLRDAAAAPAA